ncbi:MAG: AAA family ATPase [Planctomycetes bacterium]|nr:AAA family ATPase [Planctomycetota bacterium]
MQITHLKLENWRNFLHVDVPLKKRMFLVGPNASGKSNLLDVFRFLRDIADDQGGFQSAVQTRKGVSKLRSLHARRYSNIVIDVAMEIDGKSWTYRLEFTQDNNRRAIVKKETVAANGRCLLDRPNEQDNQDPELLTQTHLEQIQANKDFREVVDFFKKIRYLHIIPQLIRDTDRSSGKQWSPYGGDFLEQLVRTQEKTLKSRLRRIVAALKVAVPNLKELELNRDDRGTPHLRGLFSHWRPDAGWQLEDQFSDGTLRLLGLLWGFLDGAAPLLLEEPELSLHYAVVRHIPGILARLSRRTGRQILLSSHSAELLSDPGIDANEVLLLKPTREDTRVTVAANEIEIGRLLEGGMSIADAVLPWTAPPIVQQLTLFGDAP